MWNNQLKDIRVSPILGGAVGNALKVNNEAKGDDMFGVVGTADAVNAEAGTAELKERAPNGMHDIRTLFRYNVPSYFMVLARGDALPAGVTTFKELLEKKPKLKFVFHERGNVGQMVAERVLASHGVPVSELQKWASSATFISHTSMSEQMVNGQADVAFAATRQPAAWVLDMDASVKNLKWLPLDEAAMVKVEKESGGGIFRALMAKQSYKTQPGPFATVANDHIVIVNKNMSDDVAYNLTKIALQNKDRIASAVPAMMTFDLKSVCKDVGPWPLHPDAEKACKEVGGL